MRILLVEDERQLADGLVKALRQQDYAIDWVADGVIADIVGLLLMLLVLVIKPTGLFGTADRA